MEQLKGLTDIEIGLVMHDIIYELAIETEIMTDKLFQILGEYYGITDKKIKKYLIAANSFFYVGSSYVIGFIDNKPLKRTTFLSNIYKIIRNIGHKVDLDTSNEAELETFLRVFETESYYPVHENG